MEKEIRGRDFLDLRAYGVDATREEILSFFLNSSLLGKAGLNEHAKSLRFSEGKLGFLEVDVNAYFASVAADFIRRKLMEKRISFSFETVMSSPDKVMLLEKARNLGYRTYLSTRRAQAGGDGVDGEQELGKQGVRFGGLACGEVAAFHEGGGDLVAEIGSVGSQGRWRV